MKVISDASRILAALVLASALASPVNAIVVFEFNYLDAPGVGFNDFTQGADRRAGLSQAASYISGVLGPAYTATITLDVVGNQTNDTTLASASSNFNLPFPGNGFGSAGDVMLKILGGDAADPAPGVADGVVDWNFEDFSWEPLSDFQPGELDLISTATHEFTHALGFASDILQNGNSGFGDTPGNASAWSPFDEFVAFTDGSSIIDAGGVLDGAKWSAASIGGAGPAGLQFNGPNAVAAAGGPVYLYSPTTWLGGSSGSHLDTDFYQTGLGQIENMMNHEASVFEGLDIRQYTMIELGILKDIGYTQLVMMVPEPTSVLIVLAGISTCLGVRQRS
ncbi:hypothetical protein Pla108_15500 [Botrimarina colliarenosi]|uniref:PEP-CTERM protein-sorting domain-containing protein n=1 Tax=Botrimarina colliarenosi TaxID=2528001 RepID=A0A5C6AM83_9BACT|nr:hypothetical protein [Botrimarina colliarenosi]TWU00598.1 hypothetical protein Pla108_15500 [Botrimarina colliarenosi]